MVNLTTLTQQQKLNLIYERLLAGDFYEDYDRATVMVGWLAEASGQASLEPPKDWPAKATLPELTNEEIYAVFDKADTLNFGGKDGWKRAYQVFVSGALLAARLNKG